MMIWDLLMWEIYRRTFWVGQLFILTACLTVYFSAGRDWVLALVIFGVMELGSLASAAVGARVRRPVRDREDDLPLRRR
jgi:hypothetical protein